MNLKTISTYQQRIDTIFKNLSNLSNFPMITGCLIIFFFLFQTASTLDALIKHYIGIKEANSDEKHQLHKNVIINASLLYIISYFTLVY